MKINKAEGDHLNNLLAELLGWTNIYYSVSTKCLNGIPPGGTKLFHIPNWSTNLNVIDGEIRAHNMNYTLNRGKTTFATVSLWLEKEKELLQTDSGDDIPATALTRAFAFMLLRKGNNANHQRNDSKS